MLIKRLFGTATLFFFAFFILGCTSVPEVDRAHTVEDSPGIKKYDVEIDSGYIENPAELKYAINSFVKEQGGTSYNLERHGENNFFVTIPGKTPVEDYLPKVRHFHTARTVLAIVLPGAAVTALICMIPIMFAF